MIVNAKCAMGATVNKMRVCDRRHMAKTHPMRPYLRDWRKFFRKSQETIAEHLGLVHTTIGRWERQELGVDDDTFATIAAYYGISVAELSSSPTDRDRTQALERVLKAIRDLDAEGLTAVAITAERVKPLK